MKISAFPNCREIECIIVSSPNIVKMDEDTSMPQLENSSMVASFILFYNPMHRDQNMTNDRGGKGRNIV